MVKGDIYRLRDEFRKNYPPICYRHPFIFWNEKNADYTGIMITTSSNPEFKNIELKEEHFKAGFKIEYGKSEKRPKSYIVPLYLLKDVKYAHLEKVGELTEVGKGFISSIVGTLTYTDWQSYKNSR